MSPEPDPADLKPYIVSARNDADDDSTYRTAMFEDGGDLAMAGSGEVDRSLEDAHRSTRRARLGRLLSGETAREALNRDA